MSRFRLAKLYNAILVIVFVASSTALSSSTARATSYPGDYLYFTTNNRTYLSLSRVRPDGTGYELVVPGQSDAVVSPDGTRIAYSGASDTVGSLGNKCDLYISHLDGTNPIDITNTPGVCEYQPFWSPDGTKLLYSTNTGDGSHLTDSVINVDGSGAHTVVTGITSDDPASWSPDGKKIAFEFAPPDGSLMQIGIVNEDGTGYSLYPTDGVNDLTNPAWSPDGTRIAFLSTDRNSNVTFPATVIKTMDLSGGNLHTLYTSTPNSSAWRMAWSPDSAVISFVSNDTTTNTTQIMSVPATGGPASEIYNAGLPGASSLQWWHFSAPSDSTPPVLSSPVWSQNPKPTTNSTTLTVPATDDSSGIQKAEYFIGDNDPGQGNGATMQLSNVVNGGLSADLTTTFGTDFPTGVYKISVRAEDNAGNWSAPISDYLVVYDPTGLKMTGKRTIVPSLANGDILPGLIASNQTDQAKFGFSVKYDTQGQISGNSDFMFSYSTGAHCNKPAQTTNCHSLSLDSTSIAWLTTQDANNSTGIFQGTAALTVDGQTNPVLFRVTGVDGTRLGSTANDRFQLQIYAQGANPASAQPLYRVNMTDIARGNITIDAPSTPLPPPPPAA